MEIRASRVSVYEVELDLKQWDQLLSHQVPGFVDSLIETIPSTAMHKCMTGEVGGFHTEMQKGTNFGHVIEHVLLELIHLADRDRREFTGWTRTKDETTYVIHYGAPDFLTGRLAAILAVDLVKQLLQGQQVDLNQYVQHLQNPLEYFSLHQEIPGTAAPDFLAPLNIIDELERPDDGRYATDEKLEPEQEKRLSEFLSTNQDRLLVANKLWRKAFIKYGGDFAKGIIDKIEVINVDRFLNLLDKGRFDRYFCGVRNLSQLISSYRIPHNFVVHSTWLYKNYLSLVVLDRFGDETDRLRAAIGDVDDLFQIVLHQIAAGYAEENCINDNDLSVLREFRELQEQQKRILVVDDDDMARHVARDMLEHHGYQTLAVANGRQTLETLAQQSDDIALVLLDLVLPDMTGKKICRHIRTLYPGIKVVLSSGYPLDQDLSSCLAEEGIRFIGKPFKIDELLGILEQVLDPVNVP